MYRKKYYARFKGDYENITIITIANLKWEKVLEHQISRSQSWN